MVQSFPYVVLYPLRGFILQDLRNMALAVQKRNEEERQRALDNTTVSVFLKLPSTDENLLISALSIRLHTYTRTHKGLKI